MIAGLKGAVLQGIWRDKMHVEPRALELSPRSVQDRFEHIWAPAEVLSLELARLPLGLLRFWESAPRGHIVFTHRRSVYLPGPQVWRSSALESVCYVSMADLGAEGDHAMLALLNLVDHLLGSEAIEGQPWFSDGGGVDADLRALGERFQRIFRLGYAQRELEADSGHDYFAKTLSLYLTDPERLNVLDPLAHKLYRAGLMSEAFWRRRARPSEAR